MSQWYRARTIWTTKHKVKILDDNPYNKISIYESTLKWINKLRRIESYLFHVGEVFSLKWKNRGKEKITIRKNATAITTIGKIHRWRWKLWAAVWGDTELGQASKYLSETFINYKEKKSNFAEEKPSRYRFTQAITVNTTYDETHDPVTNLTWRCPEKGMDISSLCSG